MKHKFSKSQSGETSGRNTESVDPLNQENCPENNSKNIPNSEAKKPKPSTMNGLREPSRDELRAMEVRRQRSDRISQAMSRYLLRGYRMLADACPDCGNVLLQEPQGSNYCVACQEIDEVRTEADPGPDTENPRLPTAQEAPTTYQIIREVPLQDSLDLNAPTRSRPQAAADQNQRVNLNNSSNLPSLRNRSATSQPVQSSDCGWVEASKAIDTKLRWASQMLNSEKNVAESIKLVELIRVCVEARKAMNY